MLLTWRSKKRIHRLAHYSYTTYLLLADLSIFIAALAYAFWLKNNKPKQFESAGRLITRLDSAWRPVLEAGVPEGALREGDFSSAGCGGGRAARLPAPAARDS